MADADTNTGTEPKRPRDPAARCVLWCDHTPPGSLMKALARRGVTPIITKNAFASMAEIVVGGSMGAPPGHGSQHPPAPGSNAILLLVEPSRIRGKKAMLMSCRRYAAGLRVWVYQARAPIPLRPLDLTQLVPAPPKKDPQPASDATPEDSLAGHRYPPLPVALRPGLGTAGGSSSDRAPGLRLTGEGQAGLQPGRNPADNPSDPGGGSPSGLLSDEELAMLLADDDRETD